MLHAGTTPCTMPNVFETEAMKFTFRIVSIRDLNGEALIASEDRTVRADDRRYLRRRVRLASASAFAGRESGRAKLRFLQHLSFAERIDHPVDHGQIAEDGDNP